MTDYEDMILAKQENIELWEDGADDTDDCERCGLLEQCRKAGEGAGDYPRCPFQNRE